MLDPCHTAQARAYLHEEARTVARRPRIKIFGRHSLVLTDLKRKGACNQGKEGFEVFIAVASLVDTRSATKEYCYNL